MSFTFMAHPQRIAEARRWVQRAALLAGASPTSLAKIGLLASELVTNAVLHGPTGGSIVVRAGVTDGGAFRVEVDDEASAPPSMRRPPPEDLGGRGVLFVDTYAARWGCEPRHRAGKTVWFELPL